MGSSRQSLVTVVAVAGLGVAFLGGQLELWSKHHAAHVPAAAARLAPVVFGILVAGVVWSAVCLGWYLRHGRWIPRTYLPERPESSAGARVAVVARPAPAEPEEWCDGVWLLPAPPVIEEDNAPVLPNTRPFLDPPRDDSQNENEGNASLSHR